MKYNLSRMMCLDMYLSALPFKEYKEVKDQIKPSKSKNMPLLSWDIFSQQYSQTLDDLKTENDIKMVKLFAEKEKWQNEIDSIFENQDFEALIITDIEQKILWVNDGFTKMTGYSKTYAVNKTPKFLQGLNTSADSKQQFRAKLNRLEPFTEIITNYRKDNSPYTCEVKIIPLYAENVTHFLALERQVV
ncbi:PAS domain-containing protein [Bizionia myxarmorum]|uniref:PAS domain-containing protein n=1 Tax=Bizionia myxarmorum TaxID=291186 RepID=A0A5D0R4D0_9FLAO|nr:PAS domain-containing protein [Bizionia myxarmorum]TYB75726.1 PAS domain-containing protein [Bizionia myxarmorum]